MAPELRPGGERRNSLRYAARIEAGLRQFLSNGGFGAFTTNVEDLGGLRQLPGIACQRLMADGYGFGGEGDWKTSVLPHGVKSIGRGRPGGTSFMEDYTYDFADGAGRILAAHMLEVCPSIAAYLTRRAPGQSLSDYLATRVFADAELDEVKPDPTDVAGFDAFMQRYCRALPVQQVAVEHS